MSPKIENLLFVLILSLGIAYITLPTYTIGFTYTNERDVYTAVYKHYDSETVPDDNQLLALIEVLKKEYIERPELITVSETTGEGGCFSSLSAFIKCNEGYVQQIYNDSKGIKTVCYGHNLIANPVSYTTFTREICEKIFQQDLSRFVSFLDNNYSWYRNHPERVQWVMIDLAFNLGEGGFSRFVTTLSHIESRDYNSAAIALLRNGKLVYYNGALTHRAKRWRHLLTNS